MSWGALIGAGVSLLGGLLSSSEEDERYAEERKRYKKYGGKLYAQQKEQIAWKRDVDLQKLSRLGDKILGAQRAGYAKAGVVIDKDTPYNIAIDTARQIDFDAAVIRKQASYDIKEAKYRYKLGMPSETPRSFPSTLLTSGAAFILGGLGYDKGFYGLTF